MLHNFFTLMEVTTRNSCPKDTFAVERRNLDSKESTVQSLQSAMINLYNYDKGVCAKHYREHHYPTVIRVTKVEKNASVLRNKQRMQAKVPKDSNQYSVHQINMAILREKGLLTDYPYLAKIIESM